MALALREYSYAGVDDAPSARDEVLARYRRFRGISRQHHHDILELISTDALMRQARRLGLAQGNTLILDDPEELNYVYDLAIHTAAPERSRAVDRFARSARLATGSDEALVLEGMRTARFSILAIERRHEAAGLIATDLLRLTEVWVVDMGLEISMPEGSVLATRLYTPEHFSMTAGVNVPLDPNLVQDITAKLPRHLAGIADNSLCDHRHFAEGIYRTALASGIMDRVRYQDLPEDT